VKSVSELKANFDFICVWILRSTFEVERSILGLTDHRRDKVSEVFDVITKAPDANYSCVLQDIRLLVFETFYQR
jgi:hypothetical protein